MEYRKQLVLDLPDDDAVYVASVRSNVRDGVLIRLVAYASVSFLLLATRP